MGVVTVWEVECTKGPGRVQLGEIPAFPWNTSDASCRGQMVDAVCSFLNGMGFAQTSCGIQTLPSISAFLPSNFLLILWPPPSVCSWNLCFLVPDRYFTLSYFSGLAYHGTWSTMMIHECFVEHLPGPDGIDVFFDVPNCLETSDSPQSSQYASALIQWTMLSVYLALAWCPFCLVVLFSFYLQLMPGNNGADYI